MDLPFPFININQWYYLVGTVDSSNLIILYIDGKKIGFVTKSTHLNSFSSLHIGSDSSGSDSCITNMMHCALYNKALDIYTIANHYDVATSNNLYPPESKIKSRVLKNKLALVEKFSAGNNNDKEFLNQSLNFTDALNFSKTIVPINSNNTAYDQLILSELSLISYWKLNESSYPTAFDYKDSNNGTYKGFITLYQNPNFGSFFNDHCILFNGSINDFINVDDNSNLNSMTDLSVEAWIKTSSFSQQFIFFSKYDDISLQGYALRINAFNNFEFYAGNGLSWLTSTNRITNGQWHHVVGTVDSSGNINIYIDGILANQASSYGQNLDSTGKVLIMGYPLTGQINIPSSAPSQAFVGNMMHTAIYNSVLTGNQVLTHYQAGTGIIKHEEYEFTEQSGEIN